MPADISARKSFETGARTARETVDRGTAAVEQAQGRPNKATHSRPTVFMSLRQTVGYRAS